VFNKLKFIFNSIAYGLAIALLVVLLVPNLRSKLQLMDFTANVIKPEAMSFAYAV
jgi:hypothetical protein